MTEPVKVCIVGGGATGAALLWAIAQDPDARAMTDITLIHDGDELGGHSRTVEVTAKDGTKLPVDLGVQLISPMMYANVHLMLETDAAIAARAPITDYNDLRICCAYPDRDGTPQNWSNFPDYQGSPTFALDTQVMQSNGRTFVAFLEVAAFEGWAGKTLQDYFDTHGDDYLQLQDWLHYFLFPYLSIINGYGAALMGQMVVGDLIPMFALVPGFTTPHGSFTQPGTGWQRFTNGAQSWVQAMAEVATSMQPSRVITGHQVVAVATGKGDGKSVEVTWAPSNGHEGATSEIFDKVIITTDMQTTARILRGSDRWDDLYAAHLDSTAWGLQPGACYIHTDAKVLSPHLRNTDGQTQWEKETLQFTAYYAPQDAFPYYDLYKTYTTYIQANLLGTEAAAGIYNTMYGFIPDPTTDADILPDPDTVLFSETWIHSHFAPSFAYKAKSTLYQAQGRGLKASPLGGQQPDTNVYFAGNNTTYDSEDGALTAALIAADYVFGVENPYSIIGRPDLEESRLLARFMYDHYYDMMFPHVRPANPVAHAISSLWHAARKIL